MGAFSAGLDPSSPHHPSQPQRQTYSSSLFSQLMRLRGRLERKQSETPIHIEHSLLLGSGGELEVDVLAGQLSVNPVNT